MTSLERVLTALSFKEPDRVPLFLLLTMHGAKELHLSIEEYFSKAEYVVEGQLKLREKYKHDSIYSFFYAPIEVEAWGGDVIYYKNGPANSGRPIFSSKEKILNFKPPKVKECDCLNKVLKATEMLKAEVKDTVPIIGVTISPFSLPVMQMGFDNYIDLIYNDKETFNHLMEMNEAFTVEWGNAQLEAGATAICYFDPVSSPTIIPKELYIETGFEIAKRTISKLNGPTATHLASGRSLAITDYLAQTGTAVVGSSVDDDLIEMKKACDGKLTILGNLNGIKMASWTPEEAELAVKEAIEKASKGGGFILSDNHGEIPFQVPDETLMAISDAVHKWGQY